MSLFALLLILYYNLNICFLYDLRCHCGQCETMPTSRESIFCCEIGNILEKKRENSSEIGCIINHDGFET